MAKTFSNRLFCAVVGAVGLTAGAAIAHPGDKISGVDTRHRAHEQDGAQTPPAAAETPDTAEEASTSRYAGQGFGFDPDGDTNPATNTRAIVRIGDAAEAAFDPPYRVVTFDGKGAEHADAIVADYQSDFGVRFSPGLSRQICEGQRYFQYNSACTYRRAPSGQFAAAYRDTFNRPLQIDFAAPVCVAAMAIYPTGGAKNERYEITLQGFDYAGRALKKVVVPLNWSENTFRWRHMAGAYFLDEPAARLNVSVRSLDPKKKDAVVRFLIDDLAFVSDDCSAALNDVKAAAL
ncbi:MAG: hypothetical protein AAGC56_11910 [Pseudomonadota bacterium]